MKRSRDNREPDTRMGGPAASFPSTQGVFVSALADPDPRLRRAALEDLCRRYWKPIYRYLRLSWSKTNEDAKDLTQEFLAWVLEGDPLRSYSRAKGRFRPFLKIILRRFAGHREEARRRLKQGGAVTVLPLDERLEDVRSLDPEREFDRVWAMEIVQAARDRVRESLLREGNETRLRAYEACDLSTDGTRPSYSALASRMGVSEHVVRHWLRDVRGRMKEEIRRALVETVDRPADVEAEWNELFSF